MGYGLFRALPGDRAFLPPSSAKSFAHLVDAGMQQAAGEVAVLDRFPEVELGLAGVVFSATPTSSDDASATSKTRRSKGLVFTIESP